MMLCEYLENADGKIGEDEDLVGLMEEVSSVIS